MQAKHVLAPSRAGGHAATSPIVTCPHPSPLTRHSRVECALAYAWHREGWKRMHEKQQWRELAVGVVKAGYLNDLTYFYLAEAATGLKLPDAAKKYYVRAIEATKGGETCAGGLFDTCDGFDVSRLARVALSK